MIDRAFDEAAAYLAGALDEAEAERLEPRLFDDPALLEAAGVLLGMRDALRGMAAGGPLVPVVTETDLEKLRGAGAVVVECRPEGGRALAILPGEAAFVVARLPIDLSGARRIDVEFCTSDERPYFRTHDAPFDPAAPELLVLCSRHVALAAGSIRVRILDEADGERGSFSLDSLAG